MKRIIEIDATHWKCPDCGAEHEEAFPWESGIQGQTAECAKCRVELMVTEPISPTPIQQVRDALEASINMDSPMECYPDECDNECPYMPDCVSKKILDALQILQNTVLVNEEKLRRRIKSDLCGEYGRLNYRYPGHITEAEIDAEIRKLTKEDSDE